MQTAFFAGIVTFTCPTCGTGNYQDLYEVTEAFEHEWCGATINEFEWVARFA